MTDARSSDGSDRPGVGSPTYRLEINPHPDGWAALAFRIQAQHVNQRDLWGELAERCHLSRHSAKRLAFETLWGLGEDEPWLRHIILTEMADLLRKR